MTSPARLGCLFYIILLLSIIDEELTCNVMHLKFLYNEKNTLITVVVPKAITFTPKGARAIFIVVCDSTLSLSQINNAFLLSYRVGQKNYH